MPMYLIESGDMDELIERQVADEPVEWMGGELTYIETFQFTRKGDTDEWLGPYHPRPLLEQIFNSENIEYSLMDTPEEEKKPDTDDHFDIHALEEELRAEQSVNTRLNKQDGD